jgi:hypothetical protein
MVLFLLEKIRGNREIIIESKFGDVRNTWLNFQVKFLYKNDFVEQVYLCLMEQLPDDILRIKGQLLFNSIWLMRFKKYTVCKGEN